MDEAVRTIAVSQVDAFSTEPLTGNPAGVVIDADLTTDEMQAIARELNVSETAFITPTTDADYTIRYFTPTQEVDLCGHATVASFARLFETGHLTPGDYTLKTNVGTLDITVDPSGMVWMAQDTSSIPDADIDEATLATALGTDLDAFVGVDSELPITIADTGVPYLMVPCMYLSNLSDLAPDMAEIDALTTNLGCLGIYVFTFDTLSADAHLHARLFAPAAGIPEDPVTGTGAGAVAAYLRHVNAFDGDLPDPLIVEQGHFVDRPGQIHVQAQADPITIGGYATTAIEGTIAVPHRADDDIIEL